MQSAWHVAALLAGAASVCTAVTVHLVGESSNDVYQLLSDDAFNQPFALRHYLDLDDAVAAAAPGDGLIVVNEAGYPTAGINVSAAQYAAIAAAGFAGVYLEMPSVLPGGNPASPLSPSPAWYYDRVTVLPLAATTTPTPPLPVQPLTIMQAQGAWFQDYDESYYTSAVLGYAHVAGDSTAIYGLPPSTGINPVLFNISATTNTNSSGSSGSSGGNVWVGAIKLSCVRACRYTPVPRWRAVWSFIVASVTGNASYAAAAGFPAWAPLVGATLPREQACAVAENASAGAVHAQLLQSSFARATDWLATGSQLLLVGDNASCPAPYTPPGALLMCMLEGYSSRIYANGTQGIAGDARMDCSAETGMALAMRAWVDASSSGSGSSGDAAADADAAAGAAAALMNFTWLYSAAAQGAHNNVSDPSFGLLAWGVSAGGWDVCTYADDNARVLTASVVASAILRGLPSTATAAAAAAVDTSAWDVMILRSLLGNLRITAASGYRPGRIDYSYLASQGWRYFADASWNYTSVPSPQPHYQAQMWAMQLWAYAHTGYEPFYTAALAGLESSYAVYSSSSTGMGAAGWHWTEYATEEAIRFILPLAWLLRADALRPGGTNATHVAWLYRVSRDVLSQQDVGVTCGGIQEQLGAPGLCDACPPASNDEYGTGEAPLIATNNNETITDMLYSNNYALVSLQEAYRATGDDATFAGPVAALASYLASIQLTAPTIPTLDGAWMRGFDYSLWEAYGSAADWGWGPWSVETGWTVTWIAAGMASVARNTSLWELTADNTTGINAAMLASQCPLFFPPGQC